MSHAIWYLFLFTLTVSAVEIISTGVSEYESQAYPFYTTTWKPSYFMVYKNIPAFIMKPFDTVSFDLALPSNVNITRTLEMAAIDLNNMTEKEEYRVIAFEQTAVNFVGNTQRGDFETTFVCGIEYAFPGGGLVIKITLTEDSNDNFDADPMMAVGHATSDNKFHSRHLYPFRNNINFVKDASYSYNNSIPAFVIQLATPVVQCGSTINGNGCVNEGVVSSSELIVVNGTFIQGEMGLLLLTLGDLDIKENKPKLEVTHCIELAGTLKLNISEELYKEIKNGDEQLTYDAFISDLGCIYGSFDSIEVVVNNKTIKCIDVETDTDHSSFKFLFVSSCDPYTLPILVSVLSAFILAMLVVVTIKVFVPMCKKKKEKEQLKKIVIDVEELEGV